MPEVNYIAVVVAAIFSMVLGYLWYGPFFGKRWMALMGIAPATISREGMGRTYAWGFVTALVTAYVLARFVKLAGATTIAGGVEIGFWAWLGFVATVTAASVLYEKRSTSLYYLNNGYQLVSLAVMGAILAVWK